jgi:hypothetical protein
MARIRQIKPEYYLDDELAQCCRDARLMFPGLWQQADREGRLEDRPARLKIQIFPYDDDITVERIDQLIQELADHNFLIRYSVNRKRLIQIRTFTKHQHCHIKEGKSELPAVPISQKTDESTVPTSVKNDASTHNSTSTSTSTSTRRDILQSKISLLPNSANCASEICSNRFERFWKCYPRKEARKRACKIFHKLKPNEKLVDKMLVWVAVACRSDQWQQKQYIPHPSTFLKGKLWESDPPPCSKKRLRDESDLHVGENRVSSEPVEDFDEDRTQKALEIELEETEARLRSKPNLTKKEKRWLEIRARKKKQET